MKIPRLLTIMATCAAFLAGTMVSLVRSQPAPGHVLVIDYMKADPGKENDYLRVERNLWKPIHEYMVAHGNIKSWSLYQVEARPPREVGYNYVTLTVFDHYDARAETQAEREAYRAVHPDKPPVLIERRTSEVRRKVGTDFWTLIDEVK
jgi:L-rhamnose mutarotase